MRKDIFVARYEANGTRTWVKQFGGAFGPGGVDADSGNAITLDGNGDVFVTGEVSGAFGTPDPNPTTVSLGLVRHEAAPQ